jgi:hypothetical protein
MSRTALGPATWPASDWTGGDVRVSEYLGHSRQTRGGYPTCRIEERKARRLTARPVARGWSRLLACLKRAGQTTLARRPHAIAIVRDMGVGCESALARPR